MFLIKERVVERYDLVIHLGSQVMYKEDTYYDLAPHTKMRTEATAIAFRKGMAKNLMISGGSNFGVRYNDDKILSPANFTFDAFANADFTRKSEAAVIKEFLVHKYGIESSRIFAEGLSATTDENAEFVRILLKRRPAFTDHMRIAIQTQVYHMEKALPVFRRVGLDVYPLFTENLLATKGEKSIDEICQYYEKPKGGKQYPIYRLRHLLSCGTSLEELLTQQV